MGRDRIEQKAARAGFAKVYVRGDRSRVVWRLVCSGCQAVVDKGWGPQTSPELMVRNMRKQGWRVGGGASPLCPECRSSKPEESQMSKDAATSPPQVGPNPKIARKIFGLLDESFDEATGRYRAGYSDERIAKEADTAIELVVRLRRGAYGELAEDPRVTDLRDEIELLRLEVEEAGAGFKTRLEQLDRRLDGLSTARKVAS